MSQLPIHDELSGFAPVVHYANRLACHPGESFGPRQILDYQWIYVEQGEGEVTIAGERFTAVAGDWFAYGPRVPHQITASRSKPFVLYGVHFAQKGPLAPMHADIPIIDFQGEEPLPETDHPHGDLHFPSHVRTDQWPLTYFQALVRLYNTGDAFAPLHCRGIAIEMMARLLRTMSEYREPSPASSVCAAIKRKLEANANALYQMEWLTACTGYSHDYASKLFKQETDMSPYQYHQLVKLKQVQHVLRETERSITDIAEQMNFSSIHYFCKWFKRLTDLSPTEYRARIRLL